MYVPNAPFSYSIDLDIISGTQSIKIQTIQQLVLTFQGFIM